MEYDLDFEKPLVELAEEIRVMRQEGGEMENPARIQAVIEELHSRAQEIYANLNSWQTVQVARHKERPRAADYILMMCDEFLELHGDRTFGDDTALIGGLASFNHETLIVLAHQKGRGAKDQQFRNFGMPHPEGYPKAYRLMQMAGKIKISMICLIVSPGHLHQALGLTLNLRGRHATV